TYARFDFPPLRIVAIRTEALNFSVTMSRRTERFARKGLYLTVCRWMFRSMTPRARVSSSVRASRTSRARGGRESASNRLCSVPRIRGFHDCRNDRDTRDSVPREEGRVRRVHPTDCEHGQRRAADRRSREAGPHSDARFAGDLDPLRPSPPESRHPCLAVAPLRRRPRAPPSPSPAGATRASAVTQRGTRRRGAVPSGTGASGNLPGDRSAESDPERIAVRGLEGPAAIPTRVALFRESTDVFRGNLCVLQASDDFRCGVRLDGDQEGPFANRVQGVHAEDLRDLRDGRI